MSDPAGAPAPPLRFYVFYFEDALEGQHTYQVVLDHEVPHRLQKFEMSAYPGSLNLGRGWGRIYVPEAELDRFMALTGNRLAPEPEMYVDQATGQGNTGCLPAALALLVSAWGL